MNLTIATLATGDIVEFNPAEPISPKWVGRPFRVERILQRNVSLVDEAGSPVRTDPSLLIRSDKPFTPFTGPSVTVGTLIRVPGRDGLWVALSLPRAGRVNAARLGGDNNRILRNVSTATATVVDPTDVLR